MDANPYQYYSWLKRTFTKKALKERKQLREKGKLNPRIRPVGMKVLCEQVRAKLRQEQ